MPIKHMKATLAATAMALSIAALPANAYTINSGVTDVGDLDVAIGQTTKSVLGNANPTTERTWAESLLGFGLTYDGDKTEDVGFQLVDGSSSIVAFSLISMPSYFVVKDAKTFVLFENLSAMDWGVLDLESYFGTKKLDDLELSHVTEFHGGGVTVPEPGVMALLGLGLVGLGFARRRRTQA